MKSKFLPVFLAFSSLVFFPLSAQAATAAGSYLDRFEKQVTTDRTGRFDIGLYGAGSIIEAGDADSSGYIGGSASYGFRPWAALGISGGWTGTDTTGGADLDPQWSPRCAGDKSRLDSRCGRPLESTGTMKLHAMRAGQPWLRA